MTAGIQGWITPELQLERLALSRLDEMLSGIDREALNSKGVQSAISSIIYPTASLEVNEPPRLFDLCIKSLAPTPLPASLTNWYTVLKALDALPEEIPPLPEDIEAILEGQCPIHGDPFIVRQTHSLYLIPAWTINELEERIHAYGQEFFQEESPLKFSYFQGDARVEHANVPNSQPKWVLISRDVLPGSRHQPYAKQAGRVEALSKKSHANYLVPTLREAIGAIFFHYIASKKMIYQSRSAEFNLCTFTVVQEVTPTSHLAVGAFGSSGLMIAGLSDLGERCAGMAVVRKL